MDWQGKTKQQVENSTILVGLSVLGFILGVCYGMLWSAEVVDKKKRIDYIVSEVKKIQKERKKKKGK